MYQLAKGLVNGIPPRLISTTMTLLREKRTQLLANEILSSTFEPLILLLPSGEATFTQKLHVSLMCDKQLVSVALQWRLMHCPPMSTANAYKNTET